MFRFKISVRGTRVKREARTEWLGPRCQRATAMVGSVVRWSGSMLLTLRRAERASAPPTAGPLLDSRRMRSKSSSRRKWLVDVACILAPVATILVAIVEDPGNVSDVPVSVVAENTQQKTLGRQLRAGFRQRNGHCTEPTYPVFSFHAREGWTIDRTSVEVRCHESSKSTCNGIRDVTDRSFNYSCTVANSGFCIPPFARDGRGSCWGEIEWTEQRTID